MSDASSLSAPSPSVTIEGLGEVVRGEPVTYTFNVHDSPSSTTFLYAIDWDGDTVLDETHVGGTSLSVPHVYTTSSSQAYGLNVLAVDLVNLTAAQAYRQVFVQNWRQHPNPYDSSKMDLLIGGSTGSDFYLIYPGSVFNENTGPDGITFFNLADGSFVAVSGNVTGSIVMYLQDGNDIVFADLSTEGIPSIVQAVSIYGGAGDDYLVGSVNGDLLDGGDGNDVIFGGLSSADVGDLILGGTGRDILVGGAGGDAILGGSGEDIFISSMVDTSLTTWPLLDAYASWVSDDSFWGRVANARDSGINAQPPEPTLVNDGSPDFLLGGEEEQDWLIRAWDQDVTADLEADDNLEGW